MGFDGQAGIPGEIDSHAQFSGQVPIEESFLGQHSPPKFIPRHLDEVLGPGTSHMYILLNHGGPGVTLVDKGDVMHPTNK